MDDIIHFVLENEDPFREYYQHIDYTYFTPIIIEDTKDFDPKLSIINQRILKLHYSGPLSEKEVHIKTLVSNILSINKDCTVDNIKLITRIQIEEKKRKLIMVIHMDEIDIRKSNNTITFLNIIQFKHKAIYYVLDCDYTIRIIS